MCPFSHCHHCGCVYWLLFGRLDTAMTCSKRRLLAACTKVSGSGKFETCSLLDKKDIIIQFLDIYVYTFM